MKRGFAAFVLVGLVALACADAAQAGLIFRRGHSNNCCYNDCCSGSGYYGGGYRGGYAYGGSMYYGGGYASNCGCQSGGYVMYGGYGMPMTTGSPSTSMYGGSEPIMAGSGQIASDKARLKVTVPTPETRLWVNQQQIFLTGAERVFDVMATAGQGQKITLTAQWTKDGKEIVRKKEIDVRAGQETAVMFSESDTAGTANGTNGEQLPVNPQPDQNQPKPPG